MLYMENTYFYTLGAKCMRNSLQISRLFYDTDKENEMSLVI